MRLAVCPKVRISLIWDIESLLDFTLGSSFHMQSKGVCLFRGDFFASFFVCPSFDWSSACFFPPTGIVQVYQTGLNFLVLWLDDRQLAVWVTPCVCGNAFLHINSRVTHSVNLRAKKSIKKDSRTYQGVFCRESDQVRMCPKGAVTSPAPSWDRLARSPHPSSSGCHHIRTLSPHCS